MYTLQRGLISQSVGGNGRRLLVSVGLDEVYTALVLASRGTAPSLMDAGDDVQNPACPYVRERVSSSFFLFCYEFVAIHERMFY